MTTRMRCSRAAAAVLFALFAAKTVHRNAEWRTPLALFTSAAKVVPTSCKAHICVAAALHEVGDVKGALLAINRSLAIKHDFAGAYFLLGNL